MELHLIHLVDVEPVEDHQLADIDLIHHERTHIGIVVQEGVRIHEAHRLVYRPLHRQPLEQVIDRPHAVVLEHHAHRTGFLQDLPQVCLVEVLLLRNDLLHHVLACPAGRVKFLDALLADEQQRALTVVEALILERLLDELGLAALQEAEEQIYRNVLDRLIHRHIFAPFRRYSALNSLAMASSLIPEPMTHSLPMVAAQPWRTSGVPGT